MSKLVVFLFLFSGFVANGQPEDERRITQMLCSSAFHGRGYVNHGDSIAASYIASEFKRTGLKKFHGDYFQPFSFDVNTFPGNMNVKHGNRLLLPGVHYLVDPRSSGGSFIVKAKKIKPFILVNTELLSRELQAVLRSTEFNAVCINLSGISSDTLKKISGLSEELATLLPVIEVTDKKLTWSVSSDRLNYPLIQIQDSVYNEHESFTLDLDAVLLNDHVSSNVIGYLNAKKKTKKTIVFSAHYDHLGSMGENTFFPGANDNASGTAMLLSLANYFAKHRPDCNIVFIAFAGEEIGLLGSKFFVDHPLFKLEDIQFLINLDIMGSGEEGITVVNATLFDQEFKLLQKINDEHKLLSQIKSRGPAANSDHYWFTQKGVPSFFIYTMGSNKNYHDIFDTYENLTFNEFKDIKTLLIKFVESDYAH
jgi:aminopeptidase YwaD